MIRFRLKELMQRPDAPSQAELARRIGVPRQQVNRLVNGDIERIDLKTLDKLYVALGCTSIEDLLHYAPSRPDVRTFRERFIGELVGLTRAPVQDNRRAIHHDLEVREAAERFFDEHIARDIASGNLPASLHARLMRDMKNFVQRHGAETGTAPQVEKLEQLVRQIPLTETEG